jgi:hypothetical protein
MLLISVLQVGSGGRVRGPRRRWMKTTRASGAQCTGRLRGVHLAFLVRASPRAGRASGEETACGEEPQKAAATHPGRTRVGSLGMSTSAIRVGENHL